MQIKRRLQIFALSLSILLTALAADFASPQQRKAVVTRAERPRLVLLIVADQFRYDYLERFGDLFGSKGLKRLLRDGGSWVDTNFDHVPTYTAPGYATMLTGAYPAATGIIGNEWPDRETGKKVNSVSDDTAKLLAGGSAETGSSPRRLIASTVGDELRLATNDHAKVIGISLKDRAAILPVGRRANAAYWFSTQSGNMVSSNYYFKQLPAWVSDFNKTRPADKFFNAKWERLLPEAEYLKRAGVDSPSWESIGTVAGDTNAFPHSITGGASGPGPDFYTAFEFSPFGNDLLLSFTEQAIKNEKLGQDDDTDVLAVSFSSNDYVGHRYGPYSQEVMDVTLRFDRQLGALLDFVDAGIGLSNTLVVFTADHGVAPTPKHVLALGLNDGHIKSSDILQSIRAAISDRYNPNKKSPDPTADYIYKYSESGALTDAFINNNLYFNRAALQRDRVSMEEIERVAGEAALTVAGVVRYFTRTQLQSGAVEPSDPIARRVMHGFYPRLSGDLILVGEPFQYPAGAISATHGSPYSYDTQVPLIIMGSGIEPGRYFKSATPCDIAPTLAALLGIQPPSNVTGRILLEAIANK
jgi:predicted AlkP superfamily pyrophosphatase or phosphodiesterase